MCYQELQQALASMNNANGPVAGSQPVMDTGSLTPQQLFQMYANQAPTPNTDPNYSYKSQLSSADVLSALQAGQQGNPAPVTPQVVRDRNPASAVTGANSAEKKYTFARDAAPTPDPGGGGGGGGGGTDVSQYEIPGAPYFESYGGYNPHPPEGNLHPYAEPTGLFENGRQIVRLPTDAVGSYNPQTGVFEHWDPLPNDDSGE